ncbi:MAG: T9SS type A sorting domain-containing protein [Bacteroidetes bacterium]|nr:T9SS type A sorting domain-containing protein [Bacteroidota bacterium]
MPVTATPTAKASNSQYNLALTVGQSFTATATNITKNTMVMGFWGRYLHEPRPPIVRATDGDFQDMVLVQWTVEDDETGPPVSGNQVKLYRNGYILTTLPIEQTDYQDLNVFPGKHYTYGVTTTNNMGESHRENNIGFMNPNGVITGNIKTPSGNPLLDAKVLLTPNLGLSALFDGKSYVYFFDAQTSANRLFSGFEGNYTIETWFRSIDNTQQTIFAAVDSATANNYVMIELTEDGKMRWQHSSKAGASGTSITTVNSYTGTTAEWHHLAAVFEDNDMTMYIDGAIVGHNTASGPINDDAEIIIGKRSPLASSHFYKGRLDDLRIWKEARSWENIRKYMDITLSGEERNLAAYWKFDEVSGDIVFDLTENSIDGSTCGMERDLFKAPVFVGALTDSSGNYAIKGIYYAGGTSFSVTPRKVTSIGRSLEFNGSDDFVEFDNKRVNLTDDYTMEGWFKTASVANQTIFSAGNPEDGSSRMSVELVSGKVKFSHFTSSLSSVKTFNDELWHHYAVTYENSTMKLYIDGKAEGSSSAAAKITDLSEFVIGKAAPNASTKYFKGYLDEMRIWGYARTFEQIGGTKNQTLTGNEVGLNNYWQFNEGSGEFVNDGISNSALGSVISANWSEDIPLNEVFTHKYEPESRQATLNNSNTAVDRVDFTDISLIAVSGYARYVNTSCMIPGAMMLLNGKSFIPPIYTDENGKFTVELEPGKSGALLSVSFEEHDFVPPFIELPTISRPITALYFNDKQTYSVAGKVAGGICEYPITPSQGKISVNFTSVNGCYDTTITPNLISGMFEVKDLPPLVYQVSIDHPDPKIDAFFTGDTLSLKKSDRELNFIYRSKPEVTITGFPTNNSGVRVMDMLKEYTLDVNIFEKYINYSSGDTNTCAVEIGAVKMNNLISDKNRDTTYQFTNGLFKFTVKAGKPNILAGGQHPYQKNIQATITDKLGRIATIEEWTIVTGNRPRETFFSTTSPEVPLMIIHNPPGDGSKAFWASGSTIEQAVSFSVVKSDSEGEFAKVSAGVDVTTSVGLGAEVEFEVNVTADITETSSVTRKNNTMDEQSWKFETTETISTVPHNGDVFIGGAINILYGITDVLRLEGSTVVVKSEPILVPKGFATNYVYSEKYIKEVVIPSLIITNDTTSAETWRKYLATNTANKSSATFIENRTFDAGTVYEQTHTETISKTTTWAFELELESGTVAALGLETNGVGVNGGSNVTFKLTSGKSETNAETTSNTFGYSFADDDNGDAFTVDILTDETYGSPVFKVVSGASSCPWEPGTVPYDNPSLSIAPALQSNIPSGDPAVFNLSVGNLSQMDATRNYWLRVINETNTNGAQININGVPLEDNFTYFIPAGQSVNSVMTVYRGPEAYEYNNIKLQLVSPCQYEWFISGFPLMQADTVSFSVHFQVPCSEIDIAVPEDNWLVVGANAEDTLWVTLNGYTRTSSDLTNLELRYRKAAAGGSAPVPGIQKQSAAISKETQDNFNIKAAGRNDEPIASDWFVAASIPAAQLIDDYILVPWNINPSIVIDGKYELQAVAICSGGKAPGKSKIITGIIDRQPPKVLGAQSPADGVLDANDEIQIFFNESVECGILNPGAGDIKLFNTVTSEAIDFSYTCGGNTIVIKPEIQNYFIENQTLRAEVKNIQDKYGNASPQTFIWEFFVNRNAITWRGGGINDIVINIDQSYSTTKQLVNTGGSNRSFKIIGGRASATPESDPLPIPAWLTVIPTDGIITPGNEFTVTIKLNDDTNFGEYQTTLYAVGNNGDEPLTIDIRKLCYPPAWTFDPYSYEYSMTITATLSVEDELSDDNYDIVGVFVGEELRGMANVHYVPSLDGLANTHPYEVFINVFSNMSTGEQLNFKVWDASECRELGMIEEKYSFNANQIIGTPTSPVTINATKQILSRTVFPKGWKWFSINLESSDMSAKNLLGSLNSSSGGYIKSQTQFSQFVPQYGWQGSLQNLNSKSMYMMRLAKKDTLEIVAYPANVETDTISIVKGWNWVGYTPQSSIEVNQALASLKRATTGDLIKSQLKYAQFIEGLGWIGSLQFMDPKLGYLMYSMNPGKLLYPFFENNNMGGFAKSNTETEVKANPGWAVNPENYQYNMTVTGIVKLNDNRSDSSAHVLAAFAGDPANSDSSMWECRGVAEALYIPQYDAYMFFLMVYGNENDEKIHFKYYDSNENLEYYITSEINFEDNTILGSVENPYEFTALPLSIGDQGYIPIVFSLGDNYPNPFNPATKIGYGVPNESRVEIIIYNLLGQKVKTLVAKDHTPGYFYALWNGRNDEGQMVSTGVYIYTMQADKFIDVKKMILLK